MGLIAGELLMLGWFALISASIIGILGVVGLIQGLHLLQVGYKKKAIKVLSLSFIALVPCTAVFVVGFGPISSRDIEFSFQKPVPESLLINDGPCHMMDGFENEAYSCNGFNFQVTVKLPDATLFQAQTENVQFNISPDNKTLKYISFWSSEKSSAKDLIELFSSNEKLWGKNRPLIAWLEGNDNTGYTDTQSICSNQSRYRICAYLRGGGFDFFSGRYFYLQYQISRKGKSEA